MFPSDTHYTLLLLSHSSFHEFSAFHIYISFHVTLFSAACVLRIPKLCSLFLSVSFLQKTERRAERSARCFSLIVVRLFCLYKRSGRKESRMTAQLLNRSSSVATFARSMCVRAFRSNERIIRGKPAEISSCSVFTGRRR